MSHAGRAGVRIHGFVNPGVHRGSTVLFPTAEARRDGAAKRYEQFMTYGTQGGPTHYALEDVIAEIEGGTRCTIVGTGLAAVTLPLPTALSLMAWPMSWSRCVLAKRVKSGMFSASVAQKPTIAVSDGQNTAENWPAFLPPSTNAEGWSRMGPKPPALSQAHHSSTKQMTILIGAVQVSSLRMASMPCTTNQNCSAQNSRKQPNCAALMPSTGSGSPV
eukprot:gene51887-63445_t